MFGRLVPLAVRACTNSGVKGVRACTTSSGGVVKGAASSKQKHAADKLEEFLLDLDGFPRPANLGAILDAIDYVPTSHKEHLSESAVEAQVIDTTVAAKEADKLMSGTALEGISGNDLRDTGNRIYYTDGRWQCKSTGLVLWSCAALLDDPDARYRLAAHNLAHNVEKKTCLKHSLKTLESIGRGGHTLAQLALGHHHTQADHKDYCSAVHWYTAAANNGGSKLADNIIAQLHHHGGHGLNPDHVAARKWYHKSAETGHVPALMALSYMYRHGEGGAPDMDLALGYAQQTLSLDKCPEGVWMLGHFYCDGIGVKQDYLQAFKLYQAAADANFPEAKYSMAIMLERGVGVTKNEKVSKQLMQELRDENLIQQRKYLHWFPTATHGPPASHMV